MQQSVITTFSILCVGGGESGEVIDENLMMRYASDPHSQNINIMYLH